MNSPHDRGTNPGIIAAIVIGAVLALTLFVFFLRKRVKKRRTNQRALWLSSGGNGSRNTLRSSFGDLRASSFGCPSEDTHDSSPASPTQMTQVAYTDITTPAAAVHSIGRRSTRNSAFSIGSAGTGETESSEDQWSRVFPDVRWSESNESNRSEQVPLPSPTSVRPSTISRSWSFPKPPTSRAESLVRGDESNSPNPFVDPVTQLPPAGSL